MTVIELLPDEYVELEKVHDGFVPDPANSIAIVAMDAGEIVGRVFVVAPAHVEGPWVSEKLRGTMLFSRLIARAEREAQKRGIKSLFAYGAGKEMESYIERLGYEKQELTVWKKDI